MLADKKQKKTFQPAHGQIKKSGKVVGLWISVAVHYKAGAVPAYVEAMLGQINLRKQYFCRVRFRISARDKDSHCN